MLQDSGFTDVMIGAGVDTFGGAAGEGNARAFEVYGYAFMACRPPGWRAAGVLPRPDDTSTLGHEAGHNKGPPIMTRPSTTHSSTRVAPALASDPRLTGSS